MIICARISHERPLGAVLTMWLRELTAPRETMTGRGGAVSASAIRVRVERPRRRSRQRGRLTRTVAAPPPGPHPPRPARPTEVAGVWTPT
jgi:hypothetical protein